MSLDIQYGQKFDSLTREEKDVLCTEMFNVAVASMILGTPQVRTEDEKVRFLQRYTIAAGMKKIAPLSPLALELVIRVGFGTNARGMTVREFNAQSKKWATSMVIGFTG